MSINNHPRQSYCRFLFILVLAGTIIFGDASRAQAVNLTSNTYQVPGSEPIKISLMLSENRMIVPLKIEGVGKQYFILDTAAGGSAISPRLREQLTIDLAGVRQDTEKGASGMRLMEKVILPPVQFGGQSFSDIDAVVYPTNTFREYDGRRVEGILGVNVMRHFNLSFDLPNKILRLYHPPNKMDETPGIPFESKAQPGFVEFEIDINGQSVQAVLHSGAKSNVLNWKAANALGITRTDPGVKKRTKNSKGIDGVGGVATYDYIFDQVQLGPATLENTTFKIIDYPVFDMLGISDGPAMLMGLEIFKHCRVKINYSTKQLIICR